MESGNSYFHIPHFHVRHFLRFPNLPDACGRTLQFWQQTFVTVIVQFWIVTSALLKWLQGDKNGDGRIMREKSGESLLLQ